MLARYEPLDGSNGTWARIPYRIEPLSIELVPGSYDLQIDGIGIEGVRVNVRAVLFFRRNPRHGYASQRIRTRYRPRKR